LGARERLISKSSISQRSQGDTRMRLREKDMDALDLDVQKGKLLVQHLLHVYKGTNGDAF
jgi:hypothetical protein